MNYLDAICISGISLCIGAIYTLRSDRQIMDIIKFSIDIEKLRDNRIDVLERRIKDLEDK